MGCISCKSTKPTNTYTKTTEETFELRDLIKKEIVHDGTELYHIDTGTKSGKGAVSEDTGALQSEDHISYEDRGMYYTGSIGYKNIVTYIGMHCCTTCKSHWWVELKKKKDLRIVDYVGPFQEAVNEFFDLEATVTAKVVEASVSDALLQPSLHNYILIASNTDFFARFYEVQVSYFEAIKKTESEQIAEFFNSKAYQSIQSPFYIRNQWEEFMKYYSRKKKKKK
jgi:hypothetical protein